MIGQEFLIKVAINHEDRLQQLESQNMQEIAELKKENAERKNQSYHWIYNSEDDLNIFNVQAFKLSNYIRRNKL